MAEYKDEWRQSQGRLAAMRLAPLLKVQSASLVSRIARTHVLALLAQLQVTVAGI
jgi:hypothetical protein